MSHQTFFKPIRGVALLARREKRAVTVKLEQQAMQAAKKRDGGKCRWPRCEYAKKQLPIDAAHFIQHRGIGGDPTGRRTASKALIVSLCRIHHSLFDLAEIDIQPLTDAHADGPLLFYVRDKETGAFQHVASERSIGVSEARR